MPVVAASADLARSAGAHGVRSFGLPGRSRVFNTSGFSVLRKLLRLTPRIHVAKRVPRILSPREHVSFPSSANSSDKLSLSEPGKTFGTYLTAILDMKPLV